MTALPTSRPTIWLRSASAPATEVNAPRCSGPQDLVDRVLEALRAIRELDGGLDVIASGRVVALSIDEDEAVLTLGLGGVQCHGAHAIAEEAFNVLRDVLPGRDLYLRSASSTSCALGQGAGAR